MYIDEESQPARGGARDSRRPQLGLVAVAEFDLVATLFGLEFGETNAATRVVYGLVGLAAAYGAGALVAGQGRLETRSAPAVASR